MWVCAEEKREMRELERDAGREATQWQAMATGPRPAVSNEGWAEMGCMRPREVARGLVAMGGWIGDGGWTERGWLGAGSEMVAAS